MQNDNELTNHEILKRKIKILDELKNLEQCGFRFTKFYDINSDYETMKCELELQRKILKEEKKNKLEEERKDFMGYTIASGLDMLLTLMELRIESQPKHP